MDPYPHLLHFNARLLQARKSVVVAIEPRFPLTCSNTFSFQLESPASIGTRSENTPGVRKITLNDAKRLDYGLLLMVAAETHIFQQRLQHAGNGAQTCAALSDAGAVVALHETPLRSWNVSPDPGDRPGTMPSGLSTTASATRAGTASSLTRFRSVKLAAKLFF
jgi:hypothetical protein